MFLSSFLQQKRYGYLFISHRNNFWKFPLEWTALAAMLTVSRGVQPCTHADSTLCSMRYWLVLATCYWPVPGLLLACSLVVPLVTDLFLACFACYWLVPLVPCFRNVGTGGFVACHS